ncbi:MAG: hypothetical protein VKQ33_08475 [Candidatus Sericytochromatia bacterium]|nr:hypothetical protein [Candidatus Sericytochromatia bacterium]
MQASLTLVPRTALAGLATLALGCAPGPMAVLAPSVIGPPCSTHVVSQGGGALLGKVRGATVPAGRLRLSLD